MTALGLAVLAGGFVCVEAGAQTSEWVWMGGSSTGNQPGVYGTLGAPAAGNIPGSRYGAAHWTDSNGNFWLYGGYSFDANSNEYDLSDLWEFSPSTGEWTWMNGARTGGASGVYGTLGTAAAANLPGGRLWPVVWIDSNGNLWLFGGYGQNSKGAYGYLNDLWTFNFSTNEWTWMGGSKTGNQSGVYGTLGAAAAGNIPGGRYEAASWIDNNGNFWLFGGYGYDAKGTLGRLNDLWEFGYSTQQWTWISGSSTVPSAGGGQPGNYGTLGVPAATNVPGGRYDAMSWKDSSGDFWLLGGDGYDSAGNGHYLNDLWEFSPALGQWVWMGGSAPGGQKGIYGTLGVFAPGNSPGGRAASTIWIDSSGNLWLFGGYGDAASGTSGDFYLNDLWELDTATNEWAWLGGSATGNQPGVYGALNIPSTENVPGARMGAIAWIDSNGTPWLFGGYGGNPSGALVYLNDLWEYKTLTAPTLTWTQPAAITYGTALSATQLDATASVPGTFVYNPPAGTVLAAGTYQLGATFTPADTTDYLTGTAVTLLTVSPATPTLSVICRPVTYSTFPQTCIPGGSATGIGGATVAGTWSYTYNGSSNAPRNAGTYSVVGTFTSTNPNYASGTASTTFTINKATPIVSVTCMPDPVIPLGAAYACAAAAQDPTTLATLSGTFTCIYTGINGTTYGPSPMPPPSGTVGTYQVSCSFVPADTTDYNNVGWSTILEVGLRTPVTITSLFANNKTWDGTTNEPVANNNVTCALSVSDPNLTCVPLSAVFAQSNANAGEKDNEILPGVSITVTVTIALGGSDAGNYCLSNDGMTCAAIPFTFQTFADILQLPPPILANCYPAVQDGNQHGCAPQAIGVGNVPVSDLGTFALTYIGALATNYNSSTPPTAADTYTVTINWTPINAQGNYGPNSLPNVNLGTPAAQLVIAAPIGLMVIDPATLDIPTLTPGSAGAVTPQGVSLDIDGDVYLADSANNAIDEIDSSGYYSVYASSGLLNPHGVAADPTAFNAGVLYIADTGNNALEVYYAPGPVSPLATGLNAPKGVAIDLDENLYVADTGNNLIKEVDLNGFVTGDLVATVTAGGGTGCPGQSDAFGDGCPATQAIFNAPTGLATDGSGNIYVADSGNNLVREINVTTGMVTAVAGNGAAGYAGDNGPATAAKLSNPTGVAVDPAGNVYITDAGNDLVRLVNGATGNIQLYAGQAQTAGSGGTDGASVTTLQLSAPNGIALDFQGDVFVADTGNQRGLEINRNALGQVTPVDLSHVVIGTAGPATTFTITNAGNATLNFLNPWFIDDYGTPDDFSISGTGQCKNTGSLAIDGACNLNVAYAPEDVNVNGGQQETDDIFPASDASNYIAFTSPVITVGGEAVIMPILTVSCSPETYNGMPQVCMPGGVTIDPYTGNPVSGNWTYTYNGGSTAPTNAGSYNVIGTFVPSDPNVYASGTASSTTFVINPAAPNLSVACAPVAYGCNPQACSPGGSATNPSTGNPVSGTWTYTYDGSSSAPKNSGTYNVVGTFASSDPNFAGGTASTEFVIGPAPVPTIMMNCNSVTYDGLPQACIPGGTAVGMCGTSVSGTWAYTYNGSSIPPTNAGIYNVVGTFTSADPNYGGEETFSAMFVIIPATPTLSVICNPVTYSASPQTCIPGGSATGIGGATVAGTWTYTYNGSAMAPTNAGSYAVVGTFTSADPNYASGGTATGTLVISPAPASLLAVTPASLSLNFSSQFVSTSSVAQYISLTNTGTAAVAVGPATVSGPFAISNQAGTCTTLMSLAAGRTCVIRVVFTPAGVGGAGGSVVIGSAGAPGGSYTVTLSGTGQVETAVATLSTTSLTFANPQIVGTSSVAQYVQIASMGSMPLVVTGVTLGGANPGNFLVSNQAGTCATAGATLAYNTKCNLRIVFAPTAGGTRTATLYIGDNAAGSPQGIVLSGTGISAAQVSLSTTSLTFNPAAAGSETVAQYITLKSTGTAPVVVTSAVLGGADPGDFKLTNQAGTCTTGMTMKPGTGCNLRVNFTPQATGNRSATVTINDNTDSGAHIVTLTGAGQ